MGARMGDHGSSHLRAEAREEVSQLPGARRGATGEAFGGGRLDFGGGRLAFGGGRLEVNSRKVLRT